jgi:CIC family chloride channel protein
LIHYVFQFLDLFSILVKKSIFLAKDKLTHKQFIFLASILVGVSVGFAAVILKLFLHFIFEGISNNKLLESHYFYAVLPITGILLTVLITRYFFKRNPAQGIPGLLERIKRKSSILPKHQMYSQIITSSLTVGFGGSAGVEAPIVVTGAAYGSNFSRIYKLSYNDRTLLLACGVSSGIGAAFNAPIAGVLFALEVLLLDVSITAFIPLIIAAASGALVSKIMLGSNILLSFSSTEPFDSVNVIFYMLLGVLAGLISVYHTRVFSKVEERFHTKNYNPYAKVFVGGGLLALLILLFPSLYGEGYESIKWLSNGHEYRLLKNSFFEHFKSKEWLILLGVGILIFIKSIATGLTLGSGGNGGNFAPSLFVGAYLGFFISRLTNMFSDFKLPESNFTLVGMAGILSGIYHAPLTAIFLIAEITGGYTLMIPLMLVSSVSFAISRYFEPVSMDLKKTTKAGETIPVDKDKHILSSIHLTEIIDKEYTKVDPSQTLGELVEIIKHSTKNIFPVIDKYGSFHGIILIEEIKEIMFSSHVYDHIYVQELMIRPKVQIEHDEAIESALKKLEEYDYWFLPVVTNGAFEGFVSKTTLLSRYREKLRETIIE